MGEVIRQVTTFTTLYKHSFLTNKGKFFLFTKDLKKWNSRFWREKLTSSLEGSWPATTSLIWLFLFLFIPFRPLKPKSIQPTDLLCIIKLRSQFSLTTHIPSLSIFILSSPLPLSSFSLSRLPLSLRPYHGDWDQRGPMGGDEFGFGMKFVIIFITLKKKKF